MVKFKKSIVQNATVETLKNLAKETIDNDISAIIASLLLLTEIKQTHN